MLSKYVVIIQKADGGLSLAPAVDYEKAVEILNSLDISTITEAGVYELKTKVDPSGATPDDLEL